MKKNKGVSLLELMLVLGIIATVFIMSGRYYMSVVTIKKSDNFIEKTALIVSAINNYVVTSGGFPESLDKLVDTGSLDKEDVSSFDFSGEKEENSFSLKAEYSEYGLDTKLTQANLVCSKDDVKIDPQENAVTITLHVSCSNE